MAAGRGAQAVRRVTRRGAAGAGMDDRTGRPGNPFDPPALAGAAADTPAGPADPVLRRLAEAGTAAMGRARAPGTRRAYRAAWALYAGWCGRLGLEPLAGDPRTVSMYLVEAAETRRIATLRVHLAAIVTAHRLAGVPLDARHPRIALVLEGIARDQADRLPRQAPPLAPEALAAMLAAQPAGPRGLRNRAMLLLGFGAALRRSELVALRLSDVTAVPGRGLEIRIRRSKTDPRGAGAAVGICAARDPALCAVAAHEAWRACRLAGPFAPGAAQPEAEAALFCGVQKGGRLTGRALSDKAVARLVKEAAAAAGLAEAAAYSGHSLRAGLATAAAETEAQLHDIMRQTRHRSPEVARRYLRTRDIWTNNVTEKLFR
jgi:integrase